MRLSVAALILAVVIAFLAIGLTWAREPAGALLGILAGFISAVFWALGSVASAPWNARFNLVAALFGRRLARFPRAGGEGMQLASDAALVPVAAEIR